MLAELDALGGNSAAAADRARESLAVYTALEDDRSCARCLVLLADAAAAEESFDDAARMLGAADALRGDLPVDIFERPVLEQCIPQLEAELGSSRFSELREEGARSAHTVGARDIVSVGVEE